MQIYLAPIIIGCVLLLVVLFAAYRASKFVYICSQCKKEFKLNPFVAALAPQTNGQKYLNCPNCRTKRLFTLKYKG